MTEDIDKDEEMALAAEYVLGLLSPAEARAFEDAMAVDPAFREDYAFWAENLSAVTDDIAEVPAPGQLKDRVIDALFGDEKPAERKSIWDRFSTVQSAAFSIFAAVFVLIAVGFWPETAPTGPIYVADIVAEDQSLVVTASYDPAAGSLSMNRTSGGPREGRALEVWLIANDNPPVSLGVWPKGQAMAELSIPADLAAAFEGGVLAISDEPPGGSPTGAPTGDVLAVGQVITKA